jgi:hypothetical protein
MAISEFGKAFREARAAGDKSFTFNGKKYTTDMADDKPRSVGGTPKLDKYVPRDSDARKGEEMTSKNAKPRDEYTRSGQKSFDTEVEFVPPDMSKYKPRRDPEALTETNKPGTSTRYENTDTSDMAYKRGGATKSAKFMSFSKTGKPAGMKSVTKMASGGMTASKRADGIAQRGKTRGTMVMCGGGMSYGKKK